MGAACSCLEPARPERRLGVWTRGVGGELSSVGPQYSARGPRLPWSAPHRGRDPGAVRPAGGNTTHRSVSPLSRLGTFLSALMPPCLHSSVSPLRLGLTSIKGEMMETVFMGMISIKYQLTWEPQPGVQCVKGKCTFHFHKARSAGKEGLRFALIMPGLGVTHVAFNQTTWIGPSSKNAVRSDYTVLTQVPWAAPAYSEVQKPRPASAGLLRGPGESFALQPPGSGLSCTPAPLSKCKVLQCPSPAGLGPRSLDPKGHRKPLAVRLYGPPLRPAEASPGQREASRLAQ